MGHAIHPTCRAPLDAVSRQSMQAPISRHPRRRQRIRGTRLKRLIISADDFGLDVAVNEAVEEANRHGILSTASLMVGAPAAADAVARARLLPELRVGLHLVLVNGCPVSPVAEIPALIGSDGEFDRNLARAGFVSFSTRSTRGVATGNPRAIRGLSRHRPGARPRQCAQAYAPSPEHRRADPRDRPRLRHESGAGPGRAGGGAAPSFPRRALSAAALYQPWIGRLRRRLRPAGLASTTMSLGSPGAANDRGPLLRLLPHLPEASAKSIFTRPWNAARG